MCNRWAPNWPSKRSRTATRSVSITRLAACSSTWHFELLTMHLEAPRGLQGGRTCAGLSLLSVSAGSWLNASRLPRHRLTSVELGNATIKRSFGRFGRSKRPTQFVRLGRAGMAGRLFTRSVSELSTDAQRPPRTDAQRPPTGHPASPCRRRSASPQGELMSKREIPRRNHSERASHLPLWRTEQR